MGEMDERERERERERESERERERERVKFLMSVRLDDDVDKSVEYIFVAITPRSIPT